MVKIPEFTLWKGTNCITDFLEIPSLHVYDFIENSVDIGIAKINQNFTGQQ